MPGDGADGPAIGASAGLVRPDEVRAGEIGVGKTVPGRAWASASASVAPAGTSTVPARFVTATRPAITATLSPETRPSLHPEGGQTV